MPAEVREMAVTPGAVDGLWRISAKAVTDERGTVREFFRTSGFADLGLPVPQRWAQVNMTWTRRGAIRGLHGEAMTKLVGVAWGTAFGVYVDARRGSPTFGAVDTVLLEPGVQVLVPPGVCNGFQATGDEVTGDDTTGGDTTGGCQYLYCFDDEWRPGMPGVAVNPLDPALAIAWPITPDPADPAMVSAKDAGAPTFAEL